MQVIVLQAIESFISTTYPYNFAATQPANLCPLFMGKCNKIDDPYWWYLHT